MKPNLRNKLRKRKRRILKRIENRPGPERERPMISASNIQYELAERVQGLACGGIGAMLLVARKSGLIDDIDSRLHLLKRHLPYHESDRLAVLTVATLKPGSGCPGPCRLPDRKLGETPRDMSDGQTMLVIPRHRGCSVSAHFADREKSGVISRLV